MLIHQDARLYAGLFSGDEQAELTVQEGRRIYVHLARGLISANGQRLEAGDALRITDTAAVRLENGQDAEVLVFDLPPAA